MRTTKAQAGGVPFDLRLRVGAGDGNRTRMTSLEGWGSAIELHPRAVGVRPPDQGSARVTGGRASELAVRGGRRRRPDVPKDVPKDVPEHVHKHADIA